MEFNLRANEVDNSIISDSKYSDPDKRVDVNEKQNNETSSDDNVDKRIEVSDNDNNSTSDDSGKSADVNQKQDSNDTSENDVDKRVDVADNEHEVNGGPYSEVFTPGEGGEKEVHHMPASEASFLEFEDGPTIKMDKEDHRQTASWGRSKEACQYRAEQKRLIDQGRFREAIQMDVDDIRDKFGSKYDEAISEMLKYVDKLEMEGKI